MNLEQLADEDVWPLVLLGLRLLVAALLYLFLLAAFRTLRAELRTAPQRTLRRTAPVPEARAAYREPIPTPGPSGEASAWLEVVACAGDDRLVGRRFPVEGATVIGRDPRASIVLADRRVSARHARLAPRDGEWWIEDLGSTNGTAIDARPVHGPARLDASSELRLGPVIARLRQGSRR